MWLLSLWENGAWALRCLCRRSMNFDWRMMESTLPGLVCWAAEKIIAFSRETMIYRKLRENNIKEIKERNNSDIHKRKLSNSNCNNEPQYSCLEKYKRVPYLLDHLLGNKWWRANSASRAYSAWCMVGSSSTASQNSEMSPWLWINMTFHILPTFPFSETLILQGLPSL